MDRHCSSSARSPRSCGRARKRCTQWLNEVCCQVSYASAVAQRWGEERERHWYYKLTHPQHATEQTEVPPLKQFAPRFLDGHARANRQKPIGIAAKEMILRPLDQWE